MKHTRLLNIAAAADVNARVVTPNADVGPDTGTGVDHDIADDVGGIENECSGVDLRLELVELINGHGIQAEEKGLKGVRMGLTN